MRRLVPLTRNSTITAALVVAYGILRACSSIDRPIARFADTPGYETLKFLGSIDRFWPVPLVFHFAESDAVRVGAHVAIGTLAWAWLALVLSRGSRVNHLVMGAVLLVGLSPQVVRYDLAILSESLGISFAVMAVAATVALSRSNTNMVRLAWCATMTLCAMTRPVHLIVLFACTAWCMVSFLRSSRLTSVIPTAVLGLLSVWGLALLQGNHSTSMLNFYTVLAERVTPDDGRYQWFTSHGMPDVPGVRQAEGYYFADSLDPDLAAIVTLPVGQVAPAIIPAGGVPLATWARDHGWRTYARYVANHPTDSWSRMSVWANPTLSPHNDDFLPLEPRTIVPRGMFGDWRVWTAIGFAAMAITLLRSRHHRLLRAVAAMYGITFVVHAVVLFTSGGEHQRHSVTAAVMLRVLSLVAVSMITTRHDLTERDEFVDEPG